MTPATAIRILADRSAHPAADVAAALDALARAVAPLAGADERAVREWLRTGWVRGDETVAQIAAAWHDEARR